MSWPVSIQICTLNEESNIGACIQAARQTDPEEIIIIDGDSTDETVSIATQHGARVIQAGRIGLARQRRLGYRSTNCEFVAFVDADDRLDPSWLATMVAEARVGDYAALQSQLRVPSPHNFWTRGWNNYFQESIRPQADTTMVGRPALVLTSALNEWRDEPGMIVEDTEMSRAFEKLGLRQGIGTAESQRYCPETYGENASKWRGYGRGYRQFTTANPERRGAIWKHMLWTIPVIRSVPPALRGNLLQPVFGAVMSTSIFRGYLQKHN